MRRAMAGIAVIAAGLLFTAGCSLGGASPGGSAPSTDGIGPITFAIGKDNPGWPQGVITETVFRRYGLDGYAGTFAPDEGLTVNFAEAVQSAGGSILSPEGTKVTVNSAKALKGLEFLVNGFRQGWIPRIALSYEEESAQTAFASGKFLFMDNW